MAADTFLLFFAASFIVSETDHPHLSYKIKTREEKKGRYMRKRKQKRHPRCRKKVHCPSRLSAMNTKTSRSKRAIRAQNRFTDSSFIWAFFLFTDVFPGELVWEKISALFGEFVIGTRSKRLCIAGKTWRVRTREGGYIESHTLIIPISFLL
jgi:hypothetical protein